MKELDLICNEFDIEAELALNDTVLDNPELKLKWKPIGKEERSFAPDEIAMIVSHYEVPDILHNLLCGETLQPLINNETLLTNMVVEDEEILADFVEEAFFTPDEVCFWFAFVSCYLHAVCSY